MDDMDKNIFAPLPKSKETDFRASLPKLSNIFNNLQKSFTRSYHRQISSQDELDMFHTVMAYITRINDVRVRQFPLEQTLISMILPRLNIHPYNFKGNVFYQIQGITNYPSGYWVFSEDDVHQFYRLRSHKLATDLPQPTKADLLAILYWHHNKAHHAIAHYPIHLPPHSYQVDALRNLALSLVGSYWKQLGHNTGFNTSPNYNETCNASLNLLKIVPHPEAPQFNPYKYMIDLIRNVGNVLSAKEYTPTLQLLWNLSNTNINALNSLHDMFATIYLGQEYTNTATATRINVSIIRCKNIPAINNLLKSIFDSTFDFSNNKWISAANNHAAKRPIYSEISATALLDNINSTRLIAAEAQGVLVNISMRQGENDLEALKKVASAKTLSCTKDAIFKNTKHEPHLHYIYITDQPVPTLFYDARVIELMGDIVGTEYLPSTQDAATIVLLSLFNFFHPTKAPHEYIDATPSPSFKNDREVCETFIRLFFKDTTSTIPQESIASVKKKHLEKDLGQSKYDQRRLDLARELRITELGYTINGDIEEVFTLWQRSDPDHIPEVKITTIIKEIYDPLFYVKFNHAKSILHPEREELNVKVFYGLTLDMEKINALSQERKPAHQEEDLQKAFTNYYKDMIDNYFMLQSLILPPPRKIVTSEELSIRPSDDE